MEIQTVEQEIEILRETTAETERIITCGEIPCEFNSAEDTEDNSMSKKKLSVSIILCLVFMSVEIVGGLKAHSLAILTDAAPNRTFGYFRIEVLANLASILLTWALNAWIVCEAIKRLCHQNREIKGPLMFGVACFGVIVNSVMVFLLGHGHHGNSHDHDHDHHTEAEGETMNINVLGAYLHVIGDLLQNVGVMISAGLIWWKPKLKIIDLICTLIFSVLALVRTLSTTRKLLDILMETAPREIDPSRLSAGLCDMDEVTAVHELHIWSITVGKVSLSCHVRIKPEADTDATLEKVIEYIKREHKINHVTIK